MNFSQQIATHLRHVFFGGNWTVSNLKEHLADVTWQEATTQVHGFNTIATLTNHIGYYIIVALGVLRGGPLQGKDTESFQHPPLGSQEDWSNFQEQTWTNVEALAALVEQFPSEQLGDDFTNSKYGSYYRNLHGMIEHTHYHLGQIVLIKKLVRGA